MSYLEKVDRYLDSLKVGKSAVVDSWFMMSSPMPILSVIVAYFLLIRIGPRIMKNRPPLKMNKLLTYYNAFQVMLAAMICLKVLRLNVFRDGILYAGCRYPSHTQNPMLLDVGWWYFFAKFTELLDTVFFVLRKKNNQVTFLHVYHHVIMALYAWSYLKFAAGGEGAILALLNSFVHVVMYTYYLLAGLGPRFQKYLWWKKYVTKMQLIQFVLMLAYCSWTHFSPRCQFAVGFTYFISANVIIFLFLFLNFYSKSYKKQRDAEKEIKEEYEKARNGVKRNGVCQPNGVTEEKCEKKENGLCAGDSKDIPNLEDIPYEVNKPCGDYIKNGKVFLTRRTAKATYGAEYDFDSIIKK
ncbi:elongation of very long chain fatty acids protein 7-like [Pectinophora gossypiella]|uniref:elongation of very long chain fatty acids protein 7-like n=1 Tax=Pectinophora gossypiella TaxID=13191 RepID=UPI00214EC135|nr:elongation of very long chain fatty acids protein 7-like [Pectinophora gossypiella]XP_049865778.1 elongation of very long chain fatty acids protein 7-like [Pectinophora gossypiella]